MSYTTKGKVSGSNVQPAYTIENDGFGLLTSRLVFRGEGAEIPAKGTSHPVDPRLQAHRSTTTYDSAGIQSVSVDYVGIASGEWTEIQWSADFSASTQPIQAHPNFFKVAFVTTTKLKDLGWSDDKQTFPADDPVAETNGLAGIRSYLAPDVAVTGTFYTSSKEYLQNWVNGVGKTFESLPNSDKVVLPNKFQPISDKHDRFSLLVGVGYEVFANLYKVTFQARCSSGGWHKFIYDRAPTT
jgi:hypothetical protein